MNSLHKRLKNGWKENLSTGVRYEEIQAEGTKRNRETVTKKLRNMLGERETQQLAGTPEKEKQYLKK